LKNFFVFTGPESSGKTTLAERLSTDLNLALVPEFARIFLENKVGEYTIEEVDFIGQQQLQLESEALENQILCDTDLLTIYIWKKEVFEVNDDSLLQELKKTPRHYLLCKPNIPWIPDPLRENPLDRDRLFDLHLKILNEINARYSILDAESLEDRYLQATFYLNSIL
jgi:nicotinamide riboside kinase